MLKKTSSLTLLSLFFILPSLHAAEIIGKVIDSYTKNDTTHCTLEVKAALVPGKNTSLVNGELITINEQLGEKDGLYYYDASAIGKPKIPPGTDVLNEEVKVTLKGREMYLKMEKKSTFAPKKFGEVTAVQENRVLIDKGSLHEVRERDMYAIYDSSGRYKGKIELSGIGDFQSSGKYYHSLEEIKRAHNTEPGDKVKYLGQRKLFGLGMVVGTPYPTPVKGGNAFGGGLLWNLTLADGWIIEVLFGGYYSKLQDNISLARQDGRTFLVDGFLDGPASEGDNYTANLFAPICFKKAFFYPATFSPTVGIGALYYDITFESRRTHVESFYERYGYLSATGRVDSKKMNETGVAPIFSIGGILFPTKLFRVQFDAQYVMTPDVDTGFSTLKTAGFIYSVGVITGW